MQQTSLGSGRRGHLIQVAKDRPPPFALVAGRSGAPRQGGERAGGIFRRGAKEQRAGAADPARRTRIGGFMRRSSLVRAVALGLLAVLVVPAAPLADTYDAAGKGLPDSV